MSEISIIGLGAMGTALAEAFLRQGRRITVWNRSAGKADGQVARGAARAASAAEAIGASPVTVVCLLDYGTVEEALADSSEALRGRVLVNLTNGTPNQARDMARRIAERGARYLDGGIMAVPPMIGQPHAMLLYSGDADAFAAHEGALRALGTSRYLGADAGLASLHDLALLGAMYGMMAGYFYATALVGSERVEAATFTSELAVPWINAMAAALPGLARQIDAKDYTIDVVSNIGMQAASLANIMQAGREQGVDPALLAPLQRLVDRRVADGHGAEDISGVIEFLRLKAA